MKYKVKLLFQFGIDPQKKPLVVEEKLLEVEGDVNKDIRNKAKWHYEYFLENVSKYIEYEFGERERYAKISYKGDEFKYYFAPYEWDNCNDATDLIVSALKTLNVFGYKIVSIKERGEEEIYSTDQIIKPRISKARERRGKPHEHFCPVEIKRAYVNLIGGEPEYYMVLDDPFWVPLADEGFFETITTSLYRGEYVQYSYGAFIPSPEGEDEGLLVTDYWTWEVKDDEFKEISEEEISLKYPIVKELDKFYYDRF